MISFYARVQHWSDTPLYYQLSYLLVAISYGYRYWTKHNTRFTDTIKAVLIVFYCAIKISFAARLRFDSMVFYAFFLLGAIWYVSEIIDLIKGRTKGHRLILLIGASFLVIETVLRVRHYPGVGAAAILGMFIITLGFIGAIVNYFARLKRFG
jgi:hypothetical protein